MVFRKIYLFLIMFILLTPVLSFPATITIDGIQYTKDDSGIESALTDAIPGDSIYMPFGYYNLYGDIDILDKDNLTIYGDGDGTILYLENGVNAHNIYIQGADNLHLHHFKIDGNKANQTTNGCGIRANWDSDYLHISNLTVENTYSHGISIAGSLNPIVEYCTVKNAGGNGLKFYTDKDGLIQYIVVSGSKSSNILIHGTDKYDSSGYLIQYIDSSNTQDDQTSGLKGHEIQNSEIGHIYVHDQSDSYYGKTAMFMQGINNNPANLYIHDIVAKDVSSVCVEIQDANCVVENIWCKQIGNGLHAQGIFISSDASNTTIRNFYLENITRSGISIFGASSIIIENGTIRNLKNDWESAIILQQVGDNPIDDVLIKDVFILDDQVDPPSYFGIRGYGSGNLTNIEIQDNKINNVSYGIDFYSVSGTLSGNINKNFLLNIGASPMRIKTGLNSDYNLIELKQGNYLKMGDTGYNTLLQWQNGTGQDLHSMGID